MASQYGGDGSASGDNRADLTVGNIVRETIDVSQLLAGATGHGLATPEVSQRESTNELIREHIDAAGTRLPAEETTNEAEVVTAAAVVPKASRKTLTRSKKYLLAGKDVFLSVAGQAEYNGDASLLLQGYVAECPNKKTNDGRFRIDWEKNCSLPPSVTPAMLQQWFPSSKGFRDNLDLAIDRWEKEATPAQKERVAPKRKQATAVTEGSRSTRPNVLSTPPARLVMMQARAGLRTEASTISSLSSRSFHLPAPSNVSGSEDAAPSDDDCSIGTSSTRSSKVVDSDSEDGDDLDEEDNAYDQNSDSEHEEEEFRPHTEAPDLSVRARGSLGDYLKALVWKFEIVTENTPSVNPPRPYSGDHGLRPGVSRRFNDPLECFSECGGMTVQFIARLAANSNDYYWTKIKPSLGRNLYNGLVWKDISIDEMYHFLGIMLKISLSPIDGGGYSAYFATDDKVIYADTSRNPVTIQIKNSRGWAQDIMPLHRFKQIRGAFHPEDKVASYGKDKCYQLRHALNRLNAAALSTFVMGPNMSFDEGGSACRSRMCPVRQYNKDKPDKYRVDFFILSDSKHYFIYHMDVYQGKNDHNCYIDKRAAELPTTQKAVVNALYKTGLDVWSPFGYRHMATDNRYGCCELAAICRDYFRIYMSCTARQKRKGWNKDIMTLIKKDTVRGEYLLAYDKDNEMLCGQWRDSKVVNFVSSVKDLSIGTAKRQVGSQQKKFPCPSVVLLYNATMFGVDKGDQIRMHGGGFARKAHFKKWYKKAFLAIIDCMLLNSLIAWNLGCEEYRSNRRPLKRHEFYTWVAEAMMTYRDPSIIVRSPEQMRAATAGLCTGVDIHRPIQAPKRSRCAVCKLDSNYDRSGSGVMDNTCSCTLPTCQRIGHNHFLQCPRRIHQVSAFLGMTCYEILHSDIGRQVWSYKSTERLSFKEKLYSVNFSHPAVRELRVLHGQPAVASRKRKASQDDEDDLNYHADNEESQSQRTD